MYCDSSRFDRFVANRSLQSRIVSPEVDSQNAGTGGVNWLRFESIRSIRRESVLAKSNRFTGSRSAVCGTLFFSYKDIFYKDIEAEMCEILRIF